ncbi:hypothetical protein [Bacillus sp. FJAT-22090]|uniref:hypothetical protein n=1 Tax=Bacillus sp. FJAT-22090 TaxID=1581038 RepID=UPI0011A3A413|nr:hypothetical protein [Bacillus sp. FJAT-22090]
MKTFIKRLKAFGPYFFIMVILCCLSYFLVYQVSLLPNSYEIVSASKNELTIKSYNLYGAERNIQTVSWSKQDEWKSEAIEYQIKRQKEFLSLLFSTIGISTTLIVMHMRNRMRMWKAIFRSNLIFAILLPLIPLIDAWKAIQLYIS